MFTVRGLPAGSAGLGSRINSASRELGAAIGVAVIGTVLNAGHAQRSAHDFTQAMALGYRILALILVLATVAVVARWPAPVTTRNRRRCRPDPCSCPRVHLGARFGRHRVSMPHFLGAVAASPWVLVLVFAVSGLDAVLPFMPSESTVVAVGVAAAGTGPSPRRRADRRRGRRRLHRRPAGVRHRPARHPRGRGPVTPRPRSRAVHDWMHRLLHSPRRPVIVFARYVPGGRSTTAFAAGVVAYSGRRFRWYTALAVLIWRRRRACSAIWAGRCSRPTLCSACWWRGRARSRSPASPSPSSASPAPAPTSRYVPVVPGPNRSRR